MTLRGYSATPSLAPRDHLYNSVSTTAPTAPSDPLSRYGDSWSGTQRLPTAAVMENRRHVSIPSSVPVTFRIRGMPSACRESPRVRTPDSEKDQPLVDPHDGEDTRLCMPAATMRYRPDLKGCATAADGVAAPRDGDVVVTAFHSPTIPHMVIALLLVSALVQGFSSSIISIFINRDLALEPVQVTEYWLYIGYTIWFQPLLGYVSDAFVLCGEKRRPLFILAALGNTMIYAIYGLCPAATRDFSWFVALSMVSQFCTMGLYIPLNGLVVEVGRTDAETEEESTARMSAIMSKTMVWRSIGSLVGAVLQTCLIVFLTVRTLLGVVALLFLLLLSLVLCSPKELFVRAGSQDENFYKRMGKAGKMVWHSFDMCDPHSDGFCFVLVLGFVFVYTMMPDAGSVYYNYLFNAFSFPDWFFSMNTCCGSLGSIAGAYVFSFWMDLRAKQEAEGGTRTTLFFIFMIGSVAWAAGYVTNLLLCTGFVTETLGISADAYVLVDTFFTSLFARFAFMPTLAMAAEHAPKFFEATTFEVFSVASMAGGTVSALLTSIIAKDLAITRADYSCLWILIVLSIFSKLAPILLAYLLPERRSGSEGAVLVAAGESSPPDARESDPNA